MKVDLLVTTYKRADDLKLLMYNLEQQTYKKFSLQIFDGTPDNTVKNVIDDYLIGNRKYAYPVTYHFTGSGMTRQRNIAVNKTIGDVSIFLDDDVILNNDYIEKVVNVFKEDTDFGIAGLNGYDTKALVLSKGKKLGKRKKIYRLLGLYPDIGPAKYLPWGHGTAHFSEPDKKGIIDVDLLIGHNMAFRTEILKDVKFSTFFEQYETYVLYDDQDISLRIKKLGFRLVLCYDAKLIHNLSPSGRPPGKHYGYQAFANAYRNWKLFGSQKNLHKIKFWAWEILDVLFQLPSKQTRQVAIGRSIILIKTLIGVKVK